MPQPKDKNSHHEAIFSKIAYNSFFTIGVYFILRTSLFQPQIHTLRTIVPQLAFVLHFYHLLEII